MLSKLDIYIGDRVVLVVGHVSKEKYRLVKCLRQASPVKELSHLVTFDPSHYDKNTLKRLLQRNEVKFSFRAFGLIGCVRFLKGHHLIFISERQRMGIIDGHFVYSIKQTRTVSLRLDPNAHISAWEAWFTMPKDPLQDAEDR